MPVPQTILVVGATGLLGQAVARRLMQNGFRVRVLGRNRAKTEKIFGDPFEVVVGDVGDAGSLADKLDGCQGVHISLAEGSAEAIGTRNIVSEAVEHDIERISYVSGTTVCEEHAWFPIVEQKLAAEKAVRDSGIPCVILRPSWIMEMLANFVQRNVAICIGKHRAPYHFLAADDFGVMVSRSYLLEQAPDRALQIHGPELLPLRDAIDRYRSVLHPEIKRVTTLPYWLARIVAILRGRKGRRMRSAVRFLKYFESVGEGRATPETERLLGTPTTTLDQWLARRKSSTPLP